MHNKELHEFFRVSRSRFQKKIEIRIRILSFKDKDTDQFIVYCPSLELSGYGKTKGKAKEMFELAIQDLTDSYQDMKLDDLHNELRSLGWVQERYAKKNYSHAYVDKNGVLQNFNIDPDKVEEEIISQEKVAA